MRQKWISLLFVCMLVALPLLHFFTPDRAYSAAERRYLGDIPELTWKNVYNGTFGKEIETYLSDQIPLRDGWLGVKSTGEWLMQKRKINGVYLWGNRLVSEFSPGDEKLLQTNLSAIGRWMEQCREMGITARFLPIPTTVGIYGQDLPVLAKEFPQEQWFCETSQTMTGTVNGWEVLSPHRQEEIYYRTDHHWTTLGAFYGYNAWRASMGWEENKLSRYDAVPLTDRFYGTTYAKLQLPWIAPDTMVGYVPKVPLTVFYNGEKEGTSSIFDWAALQGDDPYSVFLKGNQPLTVIRQGDGGPRRLLVLKDSFGNSFVPFAAADFDEVHVLDLRYYHASVTQYMADNGITHAVAVYNTETLATDASITLLQQ